MWTLPCRLILDVILLVLIHQVVVLELIVKQVVMCYLVKLFILLCVLVVSLLIDVGNVFLFELGGELSQIFSFGMLLDEVNVEK
jgi:hypothetical protein